jgi:hypothetical protein
MLSGISKEESSMQENPSFDLKPPSPRKHLKTIKE